MNEQGVYETRLRYCPLNDMNTYSCREYGVVSILNTYFGEYAMLNKNALKIDMRLNGRDGFDARTDWIWIDADMHTLAEQFYGFSFAVFQKEYMNCIEKIREEIEEGRICIISMDLFWNDYKPDYYKKIHTALHDQMLVGWTADRFICYTWFHEYTLAKEDVADGCQRLTIFEKKPAALGIEKQLLTEGAEEICRMGKNTEKIIQGMVYAFEHNLAEDIYASADELTQVNLFMNLRIMARSRQRFSEYWAYLIERLQGQLKGSEAGSNKKIGSIFQKIGDIWWKITMILLKYEYVYRQGKAIDNGLIRDKMLSNIETAARLERKAMEL